MIPILAMLLCAVDAGDADGGSSPVRYFEAVQLLEGDAGVPQAELERLDPSTRQGAAALGLEPGGGAPRWVELGPSCVLPVVECLTKGKKVEGLLAENAELRRKPPGLQPVFIAAWVGFGLGILSAVFGIGAVCWAITGNLLCR
jgi:hypothetical protein